MIHIGTVHLNGRQYSPELNRLGQSGKDSEGNSAGSNAQKTLTAGRSEIVLLKPNKRSVGTYNAMRSNVDVRSIKELRPAATLARKEQAHAAPVRTK